jgi:hypothetical protein
MREQSLMENNYHKILIYAITDIVQIQNRSDPPNLAT